MNTQPPTVPQPARFFRPPLAGQFIVNGDIRYGIGAQLGQGYFGTVYECWDEWGNGLAAKVLIPRNQSYEQVRDSWFNELQSLLYLRHPNITFIYDAFEYEDTFYLVMERCSDTLTNLINLPGLNGDVWLPYLARDILQAIHFIHKSSYVHKDIHPGNVFVHFVKDRMLSTKEPVLQFKIGDVGIARLETDINIFNTMLAEWMLPPEFLDPAQFGVVGKSVDIYHTGLLFLSLLLGRIPQFTRDGVLQGVPRQTAEGLPSRFGPVVASALRRHVSARPNSVLEFWRNILAAHVMPDRGPAQAP